MARDRVPIVKQSRREGFALSEKAVKIMAKRQSTPGQHSSRPGAKPSLYNKQLREKQKVRHLYGLMEKQFAKIAAKAMGRPGIAGENLLALLESRIDNAVYRAGFANTRRAARQMVTHGHFTLNGKKVTIPSLTLKAGDVVEARAKSKKSNIFMAATTNQAGWLEVKPKDFKFTVAALPVRTDVQDDIHEQLIIEYYSR
ncbi:MAG: 30S ribosomal protein S4 [Candidatus Nomurabacteria bacterium]|jgi:small subunit ribosomal protein S4|nr:30S ribosomal protein S4 [Candidatus Nomurabacteria bacterium]